MKQGEVSGVKRKIETVNSPGWVEALNAQGLSDGTEILLIGEDRALKRIMRILRGLRRAGLQIEYCVTRAYEVKDQ